MTLSSGNYSAAIGGMIDRAAQLTAPEIDDLAMLWGDHEGLTMFSPGTSDLYFPITTNSTLIAAWERALHSASEAGRADELDAVREAGLAIRRCAKNMKISVGSKSGAEEATRSAVLAVAVRDLISDEDFQILVAPWQTAIADV
jgi:hypothetical protein